MARTVALFAALAALLCAGCSQPPADSPSGKQTADPPETDAPPSFPDVTSELGIEDPEEPWPDGTYFFPEIMPGGVALLDYDNDRDLDILHARVPPPGSPEAPAPNRLLAQKSDGTFEDVTAESGLGDPGYAQGLAVGDIDNDGDPDVYVANYGPDALYRNNGDGTFTDVTQELGIAGDHWSVSAVFCDFDQDGWLDLYVVHYVRYDEDTFCRDSAGRQEYCGPQVFPGAPDTLYRNRRRRGFRDVTAEAGIVLPDGGMRARGLGVVCTDLTGDGRADFYVANDAESNQLWVNRGDGTFVDEALVRGVAVNRYGVPEASMGVSVGDANGDTIPDLFMTHLVEEHNTLYVSRGDGTWEDRSAAAGMSLADAAMTGFGCAFEDFDHDGFRDLAVANGRVRRGPRLEGSRPEGFWQDYAEPNLYFRGLGDGRFRLPPNTPSAFSTDVESSRGLAAGDLDGDGDLDLVLSNVDNTLRVYRNDVPKDARHWQTFELRTHRRDALGAQVFLHRGRRVLFGALLPGSSYGSSGEARVHFGLGESRLWDRVEVLWPNGYRESFFSPVQGGVMRLDFGEGTP